MAIREEIIDEILADAKTEEDICNSDSRKKARRSIAQKLIILIGRVVGAIGDNLGNQGDALKTLLISLQTILLLCTHQCV